MKEEHGFVKKKSKQAAISDPGVGTQLAELQQWKVPPARSSDMASAHQEGHGAVSPCPGYPRKCL